MFTMGMSLETINKCTGLSVAEIELLLKKHVDLSSVD
jgi:hypothetical protein